MTKPTILAAAVLTLLTATAAAAQTTPPDSNATVPGEVFSDNELRDVTGPVLYESADGDYRVTLPPGCAVYRERRPNSAGFADDNQTELTLTVHTSCDRSGYSNEGCSVSAFVDQDLDRGPAAEPGFVMKRIESTLQTFGVEILRQQPYRRQVTDGPLMEGLDVLAADPDRNGQVWVRGLLVEGDVYVLTAWRAHGELQNDPDFIRFFNSFVPHM